jgi:hypothetical protein
MVTTRGQLQSIVLCKFIGFPFRMSGSFRSTTERCGCSGIVVLNIVYLPFQFRTIKYPQQVTSNITLKPFDKFHTNDVDL